MLFLRFSKKKKVILGIIFLLFLLAGGFFYRQEIIKYLEEKEVETIFALSKDFTVYENNNEKFIESEKDGLTIKMPDGWNIETGSDAYGFLSDTTVTIYSNDYSPVQRKGCAITIEIVRAKENNEYFLERNVKVVKEDIAYHKKITPNKESYQYREVIKVKEYEALMERFGNLVIVEIPTEKRVFSFQTSLIFENCFEVLNSVLKSISIK